MTNYLLIEYRGKQYAATHSFWGMAFHIPELKINVWKEEIKLIAKIKIK